MWKRLTHELCVCTLCMTSVVGGVLLICWYCFRGLVFCLLFTALIIWNLIWQTFIRARSGRIFWILNSNVSQQEFHSSMSIKKKRSLMSCYKYEFYWFIYAEYDNITSNWNIHNIDSGKFSFPACVEKRECIKYSVHVARLFPFLVLIRREAKKRNKKCSTKTSPESWLRKLFIPSSDSFRSNDFWQLISNFLKWLTERKGRRGRLKWIKTIVWVQSFGNGRILFSLCVMKLSGESVFEKVPIAFKGRTEATDQHAPIQWSIEANLGCFPFVQLYAQFVYA